MSDQLDIDLEPLPEGWPDVPDAQEVVLGGWADHKTPSSLQLRRFLAEVAYSYRHVFRNDRSNRPPLEELRYLRGVHRQHRDLIQPYDRALRKAWDEFRLRFLSPPSGGIQ